MNTKKIFQNLAYVLLGSIIAVGLSYAASAATFNAATPPPPSNNTAAPINVGSTDQVKQGGLSVLAFIANQNAELDGNTYFTGTLHADPANTNSAINFGGTDPNGILRNVALAITGGFSNTGSIASAPLINQNLSPVCADANGTVLLCGAAPVCPAGDITNADGSCSPAPKRFYSITTNGDKTYQTFGGGVINGHVVYHTKSGQGIPWIAALGLDNDDPYGWRVDDIATVNQTTFSSDHTKLLTVSEKGSYDIKISSQGKIGIQGKFSGDNNFFGVMFYMVIDKGTAKEQWISLDNSYVKDTQGGTAIVEPYPAANSGRQINALASDAHWPIDSGDNDQKNGDQFAYAPYGFNFEKVVPLNTGDTLDVEAELYGISQDTGLFGNVNSFIGGTDVNNFNYSIETPYQGTIFDITETPS
jgi:hypothetical protein